MNGDNKPEYIKRLEQEEGIFSLMGFKVIKEDQFNIIDSKLETVWSISSYVDGDILWEKKIFKTKQNFYIVAVHDTSPLPPNFTNRQNIWFISIYYRQEQFNELILFIKSLSKELENARTNNTRT